MSNISELLNKNPYPGRGIILGHSPDDKSAVIAYFIMGRSVNSRNRIFTETDDGIRTEAFDSSKMTDPSLVIYHPVRVAGGVTVVTNGTQTDTIADALRVGKSWEDALRVWEFEPDGPIFTPRVSGIVFADGGYRLSILKTANGNPTCCCRYFYEYDTPIAGTAHFISTYQTDGDPPPSFTGDPKTADIDANSAAKLADSLWPSLNTENKVSLFVRYINIATGKTETIIKNKHKGD